MLDPEEVLSIQHGSGAGIASTSNVGAAISTETIRALPKLVMGKDNASFERWHYAVMSTLRRYGLAKYISMTEGAAFYKDNGKLKKTLSEREVLEHDNVMTILLDQLRLIYKSILMY